MSKISSKVVLKTFFNKNDSTIINGKEEIDELVEVGIEVFRVIFFLLYRYPILQFGIILEGY